MNYTVTLIPGDGIGPEVTDAVVKVVEATGVGIEWESVVAGAGAIEKYGKPLPDHVLNSISKNRIALKGPVTTPVGKGFTSVNVTLRKALDLYVSLRPVKSHPGVKTKYEDIDLVVFRENTEGLYSGREHLVVPGVAEGLRIITKKASERIAKYAFEYAKYEGRRKITIVHKASIMKLSDGLFISTAQSVAEDYPYIEIDSRLIDNTAMELILNPRQFDVLLMENLFGDILSDLCAGLVGGLGLVPGANIGDKCAVFEAVHGSAPDIAGKNLANPIAIILSAALMLNFIGERNAATGINNAIHRVLTDGQTLTGDLGGTASTTEITQAIIDAL